jgi:hypothetical protein
MDINTLKQPRVGYIPARSLPPVAPARSRLAAAALVVKHIFLTIGLVFFCIGMSVAMWYSMENFVNTSYKMVALFIELILMANATGKYVVWCINH